MSKYCNNCFCCGHYLVPRYKRLVNNIFSQNPQHSVDRNNLERLRFYAIQKPEKLHKSFRYMSEKIARYLRHQNLPYVILGIKAMDDTVKSCCEQLNTFIDHYLATLHLLLEERDDLELIEHAIHSFESFCEIRQEAPNYQRDYEFFVDRFTQLCHDNDPINKIRFRYLGLRGHQALIRKTAGDELHNDVWKHMNQIIPSIIFNMKVPNQNRSQDLSITTISLEQVTITTETLTENDLNILANTILKDLFCRVHVNDIPTCIKPVLNHLDLHELWTVVDFPKYIFSEIMNSVNHYNSYSIIDLLLDHLELYSEKKDMLRIKTCIMQVIHICLIFAATNTGVESTIFSGLARLIKCLEKSFHNESRRSKASVYIQDEQQFQNAVIDGIREFTEKLRDYQIMEVAATYQAKRHDESTSTQTTFPHQLFDPLIKMMSASVVEIRLIILEILILLIDKRHYADKIRKIRIPKDISQLNLSAATKTSHLVDMPFMKKYGERFLRQLYNCILMNNNTKDIFYTIYCLMNIVTLEVNDQDILVDIIHFCFEIQSILLTIIDEDYKKLSKINCNCIHALIAAYFNLMSKLYGIEAFSTHVDEVIQSRELSAPHLLPPNAFQSTTKENLSKSLSMECLFSEKIVIDALKLSHYDISRFDRIIHKPG
ncbi:unnamed protein product [Adineta steineri]|uniref:EFR3-like protein n=1 Tax=Adineta steineri TaxID=433720 RepID=A0A815SD15_9BILA|nr:unnamed protein product [Adineta steineri]CAF1491108.1 unnamed protein product [Adineta steineri]CAF1641525.1 unnamed protein product [Adineta steineri]